MGWGTTARGYLYLHFLHRPWVGTKNDLLPYFVIFPEVPAIALLHVDFRLLYRNIASRHESGLYGLLAKVG